MICNNKQLLVNWYPINYLSGNRLQAVVYYLHVPVYGLQARVKNSDLLEAVSSTKLKSNYSWEAVNCTPILRQTLMNCWP